MEIEVDKKQGMSILKRLYCLIRGANVTRPCRLTSRLSIALGQGMASLQNGFGTTRESRRGLTVRTGCVRHCRPPGFEWVFFPICI